MEIEPIGHIETGYMEKFGVPRQPGLVKSARGVIVFAEAYRGENFLRGVEGFSHLWLLFHFHKAKSVKGRSTVRPPRLGGNERRGVFATRSSHRPNGIGMSVVELLEVDYLHREGPALVVAGVDLVTGTPLLDVKPYIEFCDSLEKTKGGFVSDVPMKMPVHWMCESDLKEDLKVFIEETLAYDPRPAYQVDPDRIYGCRLGEYEVKWSVLENEIHVHECKFACDK